MPVARETAPLDPAKAAAHVPQRHNEPGGNRRLFAQIQIDRGMVIMSHSDPCQAQALGKSQDDVGGVSASTAPFFGVVGSRPECASDGVVARASIPASRIAFNFVPSSDAVGSLEFPDIGHDRCHITPRQPRDREHVSEPPVVGPDAPGDRPLKRLVAMVAGLVDDVDQRRGDPFLSRCVPAVTGRTVGIIGLPPELRSCREGFRHADRNDWRSAAGGVVESAEIEVSGKADAGGQDEQDGGPLQ